MTDNKIVPDDKYSYQHIVFPISIYSLKEDEVEFVRFLGSGFFIGNEGYFLTAKHVLNNSVFKELKEGEFIGIQFYNDGFRIFKVDEIEEYGEQRVDLAIGLVKDHKVEHPHFFSIEKDNQPHILVDFQSYGYPNYLVKEIPTQGQVLKGYINRISLKNDNIGTFENAPASYILSSAIPSGMSGSPIYTTNPVRLIGVCLGSYEISTTLWQNIFLEEDGSKTSEKTDRVIENGIGLIIHDYLDWSIEIAQNRSLLSLVN
jgi:hypothetical protein